MKMAENLQQLGEHARKRQQYSPKTLQDGSRIAVIGAGPAGSMFSYFVINMAEAMGLDVAVDIFEPRQFCHRGPADCNHSGGIV